MQEETQWPVGSFGDADTWRHNYFTGFAAVVGDAQSRTPGGHIAPVLCASDAERAA